jgi:hypothetical protein
VAAKTRLKGEKPQGHRKGVFKRGRRARNDAPERYCF